MGGEDNGSVREVPGERRVCIKTSKNLTVQKLNNIKFLRPADLLPLHNLADQLPLHNFDNGFPQDAADEEVNLAQLGVVAPANAVCI